MNYLHCEELIDIMSKYMPENSILFEGGTFQGKTLNQIIQMSELIGKPFSEVYSLDSFEGLPAEDPTVPNNNKEWPEGAFNVKKDFNLKTTEECMDFVRSRVSRKDINLIPGWFENTLTKDLADKLKGKIGYLHVDCDIYRSTMDILKWAYGYRTLAKDCIIRFDDWHNYMEWHMGQPLAHKNTTEMYGVVHIRLAANVFIYKGQIE